MGSGLSDTCRDAGMYFLISAYMSEKLILEQDCGIRNKGPSAECCQHAQQPKPYGSSRLRSRGIFPPFPEVGI